MAKYITKIDEYINFFLKELTNGNLDRSVVIEKFAKRYGKSPRTADKYWYEARKLHKETIHRTNETISDVYVEAESEAIKLGLNNKNKIAQELWANIQRLREIKAGTTMMVRECSVYKGDVVDYDAEMVVTWRDEVSSISEQTKAFAQIAQLYGLTSDSDKGGKVTVIVNSDEVKLISDEI